jgi:hypothetical protein
VGAEAEVLADAGAPSDTAPPRDARTHARQSSSQGSPATRTMSQGASGAADETLPATKA